MGGGGPCAIASAPNQFPLAIDALGTLYAVTLCDGALELFTSPDSGTTIAGPVPVPGATNVEGDYAVAADRARAWVAFEGSRGLQLARTTDAGRTWSACGRSRSERPTCCASPAARDTVVITGTDGVGHIGLARSSWSVRTAACPSRGSRTSAG